MSKNTNTALILVGIAVIAIIVLSMDPNFTFTIPGLSSNGSNTWNYYTNETTLPPSSDSRAPSSMYAVVEPNPITMGSLIAGRVTSDGYKYPILNHARHKGSGTEQTFGGLLDSTGKFTLMQTMNIPGYWEFWVTAGTVLSNKVSLTVKGIATSTDRATVSKSASPTCIITVWSNYAGNVQIIANDPSMGVSIPMTNTVINSGGYGYVQVDWSSFATGNYEVDALINGETATMYSGACWVAVGR